MVDQRLRCDRALPQRMADVRRDRREHLHDQLQRLMAHGATLFARIVEFLDAHS